MDRPKYELADIFRRYGGKPIGKNMARRCPLHSDAS